MFCSRRRRGQSKVVTSDSLMGAALNSFASIYVSHVMLHLLYLASSTVNLDQYFAPVICRRTASCAINRKRSSLKFFIISVRLICREINQVFIVHGLSKPWTGASFSVDLARGIVLWAYKPHTCFLILQSVYIPIKTMGNSVISTDLWFRFVIAMDTSIFRLW